MVFTFSSSDVIQEHISDVAVDLANKTNSGHVTADPNFLCHIKLYITDIMFSINKFPEY